LEDNMTNMICTECGYLRGHELYCSQYGRQITCKPHDNTTNVPVQSTGLSVQNPVIKFKKLHPGAVIPYIATEGSVGFDLTAIEVHQDVGYEVIEIDTGIAVQIPTGYVGMLVPRSSVYKTGLSLCNSCGIIDSDYRGSIKAKFYNIVGYAGFGFNLGDRFAQLVVVPCLTTSVEVDELNETVRGSGGFGSSGK
jgi:dUTP pyrophosphatase